MVDRVITTQELVDAQKDAQTIEEVVNGPANTNVTSRLGRVFPTLATMAQKIFSTSVVMEGNNTQQQINAGFTTSLSEKESASKKNQANGYVGLDEDKKIDPSYLTELPNAVIPQADETKIGVVKIATPAQISTGTDDKTTITPKKFKDFSFGRTGSYANVTASRLGDTVYTNPKNTPLVVVITAGAQASTAPNKSSIICGVCEAVYASISSGSMISTQIVIVPPLAEYKLNNPLSIVKWMEW